MLKIKRFLKNKQEKRWDVNNPSNKGSWSVGQRNHTLAEIENNFVIKMVNIDTENLISLPALLKR